MKILKFGGTSVANAENIKKIISIIKNNQSEKQIIVVSALAGVTNQLIKLGDLSANNKDCTEEFNNFETRHLNLLSELIKYNNISSGLAEVKFQINEVQALLKGISLTQDLTAKILDQLMSFGERLSAYIISSALNAENLNNQLVASQDLISTDNNFGFARVDFELSNSALTKYFNSNQHNLYVMPGFIAKTAKGEITTLGRGGSDYTVAIVGSALKCKEIEIWTDVDGIMTADPNKVKSAFSIEHLTYQEAMELSHFGAKVIYLPTVLPAMRSNIPIRIKNTFNPNFQGSVITNSSSAVAGKICGLSTTSEVALFKIQGAGLAGIIGTSERVFRTLASNKINVVLISQASSEFSICFAIQPEQAELANKQLTAEFKVEIDNKLIEPIDFSVGFKIVAVVGQGMKNIPGTAGKMFNALGRNGINIVAIAQGSTELNISAVISAKDEIKALNALHDAFFLSEKRTAHLFIVGTGLVGKELLKIVSEQIKELIKDQAIELKVIALANSKFLCWSAEGLKIEDIKDVNTQGTAYKLQELVGSIKTLNLNNSILIDCTASSDVAQIYPELLKAGISVVTANKIGLTEDFNKYQHLQTISKLTPAKCHYETTVGAGLPVIGTLKDLILSGDKIIKIEAVLSGTLSFIFNSLYEGKSFDQAVKMAKDLGYTEPDPRDDLSGLDSARKLLILIRECGTKLNLSDIEIEQLLSKDALSAKSVEQFLENLKIDAEVYKIKIEQAKSKNCKLMFIAKYYDNQAKLELLEVDNNSPFFQLSGADNMIAFTTSRYSNRPLVIKGPGAGSAVTAGGIFADIIKLINY